MRRIAALSFLALGLVLTVQAQQKNPSTLPFKARIPGDALKTPASKPAVSEDLIFTLYDESAGGVQVFQERQTVKMYGDIFVVFIGAATHGGLPAAILYSHSIAIEFARASAPTTPLAARALSTTQRRDPNIPLNLVIPVDPSICFTCGDQWPIFAGGILSNGAFERGSGCSDDFQVTQDTFPFLCSR